MRTKFSHAHQNASFILFENRREAINTIEELLSNLEYLSLDKIVSIDIGQADKHVRAAWKGYINNVFYYVSSITVANGRIIKLILPDNISDFVMSVLDHEVICMLSTMEIVDTIDFNSLASCLRMIGLPNGYVEVVEVGNLSRTVEMLSRLLE